jgi:hypothetical protein
MVIEEWVSLGKSCEQLAKRHHLLAWWEKYILD